MAATSTFADRPQKKLVLFDVDGTLSLARQVRNSAEKRDFGRLMDWLLGCVAGDD